MEDEITLTHDQVVGLIAALKAGTGMQADIAVMFLQSKLDGDED